MKPANWCRVQCSASEAFLRWVIVLSFLLSLSCIHVYAATTFFTVGPQDRTYVAGSGGMRVIDNPSGAYFTSSTSNHAGAIKITLPFNFTSTMMFLTIKGFEYDTLGSWVVEAGGIIIFLHLAAAIGSMSLLWCSRAALLLHACGSGTT